MQFYILNGFVNVSKCPQIPQGEIERARRSEASGLAGTATAQPYVLPSCPERPTRSLTRSTQSQPKCKRGRGSAKNMLSLWAILDL